MAKALLVINAVIALLDQGHVLHQQATHWLARAHEHGRATCPIPENGVVRIRAQPAYPKPQPAARVAERLAEACRHPSQAFWPQPISLLQEGLIDWQGLLGPHQISDAVLLALAVIHRGRSGPAERRSSSAPPGSAEAVRGPTDHSAAESNWNSPRQLGGRRGFWPWQGSRSLPTDP